MFDAPEGTIDHERERRSAARRGEFAQIREREARDRQRVTVMLREASDDGDWPAAGCASEAEWFAQVYRCDYRTALLTTNAAKALRDLPVLDAALGRGELTFDQVSAATPFATPETELEPVRVAGAMAPREIARKARTLSPPTVSDDAELRRRRGLSMNWIEGGRELALRGQLPLEQGVAFQQAIRSIADAQRAADRKTGEPPLTWQQSTADALVTLATNNGSGHGHGPRRQREL